MSWLVPCDYLGRRMEGCGVSIDVVKMTMKNKLQRKEIMEKTERWRKENRVEKDNMLHGERERERREKQGKEKIRRRKYG